MNPFFNAIGNQNNLLGMIQQFRQNPRQALMRSRFNIPQNVSDPNEILNYLVRSGQVSQTQINNAYQTAQRFGLHPSCRQMEVNKSTKG